MINLINSFREFDSSKAQDTFQCQSCTNLWTGLKPSLPIENSMKMLKNLEGYRIIVLPHKIWVTGGLRSPSFKQIKKVYSFDGDVWQSEADMNQVKTFINKLNSTFSNLNVPWRSKKAGRFGKLLAFARSHSIVTRGSVSVSCATTPHASCFS